MSNLHFSVNVSNPTLCNENFGKQFISYKVSSDTIRPGFRTGLITVDRRYRQFTWLHTELTREFPGFIIPPLPEKQAVGRFSTEFIESRRRSLERFLIRVSEHPVLGLSKPFILFLQADDSELSRAKDESKANKPKLATTALHWLEGTMNTMTVGKHELEKSAADLKIDEMSQYITQLEKQITSCLKSSEALSKRSQSISQAMFEFGQGLTFLGQSEGDAVGTGLSQMGTTLDTLSTVAAAHVEQEIIKFVEPLEDYSRTISSIKAAISQRQDKKSAYLFAIADAEAKDAAHKKIMGTPGKEAQVKGKETAAQQAEEARNAAKEEYEKVTERLVAEFDVFKSKKAIDLKEMIVNFVSLQIEFNKKAEDAWNDLLPRLEAISLSTGQEYLNYSAAGKQQQSQSRSENTNSMNRSNFSEEVVEEDFAGV